MTTKNNTKKKLLAEFAEWNDDKANWEIERWIEISLDQIRQATLDEVVEMLEKLPDIQNEEFGPESISKHDVISSINKMKETHDQE